MALSAMVSLSAVSSAWAQESAPVLFEQLTWKEIQADISAGKNTIIIPVGGTEQSGPYIAVGKHNTRVMVLAQNIAAQVGKTLVAPVVAYVPEGSTTPRTSHMRFPGTITVPADVFEKLLISAAESFQVQGFKLIVLIGDHGGYQKSLEKVEKILNQKWQNKSARILYIPSYYTVVTHQYAEWLKSKGYGKDVGMHADISDTSLQLALAPSMVRAQALRASGPSSVAEGMYGGDPRRASAALGQAGAAMQVHAAVQAIEQERSK